MNKESVPLSERCFWIDGPAYGRIGIMPHPCGDTALAHELRMLRSLGADMLVSLLEPAEAMAMGLADEAEQCARHGLVYRSFPIPDFGIPAPGSQIAAFIDELVECLARSGTLMIHCRGGIGRSSMIAAAVMMRCGISMQDALNAIRTARGADVPETAQQRGWIERFSAMHSAGES